MSVFERAFLRKRKPVKKASNSIFNFFRSKNSDNHKKFYILAEGSYLHNDVNEALKLIESCIKSGGNEDWKNFAFKANALEDLQKYADAISCYEKAIELSGDDANVYALYHQIGFCYLNIGNNQKANEFYTYAIDLKNDFKMLGKEDLEGMDGGVMIGIPYERMYNNRGNALKNLNKLEEAIENCNKAINFNKNYSNPYLLLSQIFKLKGNEGEQFRYLNIAAQLGNNFAIKELKVVKPKNTLEDLEYCLNLTFQQKDLENGEKLALELINNGIDNLIPYLCMSAISATKEEWNYCEMYSSYGLKYARQNEMLLNHMGVSLCEQGKTMKGLAYLKEGKELNYQSCIQNYNYWNNRSRI
ncbi:conserved hypothetical protein [Flavobacterium psychrophilum]|uniref:tetratricopeptide repeat protein n=1 Tax=Flavobacterium psychrophilum TaxID=96345 RepID=UPI000B7C4D2D|nr:tetratricopeptide repeat protein [Flavobacterium psychrophilum]SNB22505.1 conserved hypothetical protein [Flavobacterium psychrophilum]